MSAAAMFPSASSVGLIGKAPAQADFLRIDAAEAAAQELLAWIQEADDGLRRVGGAFPPKPIAFLFASATARAALVGALAPSRDQVGRAFPLAAFTSLPADSLVSSFSLVPLAFRAFLIAAGALLEEAQGLSSPQLTERTRALPRITAGDWRTAEEQRRTVLDQASAPWVAELASEAAWGPHYAFRTFLSACKDRAVEPPRTPIVLSCPLGSVGPSPWLELAGRILRWKTQPPSLVWTETAPARLLLSLGASPGPSLSYLARPEASAASLWPLATTAPAALQAARDGLSPERRSAIEGQRCSIGQLISSLAP